MAKAKALRKRDLREMGWKALVAELGVTNATRFIVELSEGELDYSQLRGQLFAKKGLDELYSEMRSVQRPRTGRR